MPAGRGRKRERPSRSRCGKQSASVVVPQNPSSSIVPNQSQKFPDGAQLRDMYPAPGLPSVATHHIQLGSLYPALHNQPSFPILEAGLIHTCHHFKLTRKAFLPKLHPSSAIFVIPTIGSSWNMTLRFVAAFVLPRGIANKC